MRTFSKLLSIFLIGVEAHKSNPNLVSRSGDISFVANEGALTQGIRPVQQLTCVSEKDVCDMCYISEASCSRSGDSWSCDANWHGCAFDDIEISCETSSGGNVVDVDSCALSYSVKFVPHGHVSNDFTLRTAMNSMAMFVFSFGMVAIMFPDSNGADFFRRLTIN